MLQAVAISAVPVRALALPRRLPLASNWLWWACAVIMGIAVALTVVTGADYLIKAWRSRRG